MSEDILVKLIEKRLQAWADEQDVKIAFEGVPFKPPTEIYARVRHLPAPSVGVFLEGGTRTLTGLWQVTVSCPQGKGIGPGRTVALTLSKKFPDSLSLAEGNFKVQLTSPVSLGPVIEDPEAAKTARSNLPCSFAYRADVIS
jgi:hypothetical protein